MFHNTSPHVEKCKVYNIEHVKMTAAVKEGALQNKYLPTRAITEKVMNDTLIRCGNRVRARDRPKQPTSIEFTLALKHSRGVSARHLLFATPYQLALASKADRWAADATFGVVADPFYQLFSIHTTIRQEQQATQVPLIHVMMSRRTTEDYVAVFRKLLEFLPKPFNLRQIIVDFESAVWKAIRIVFPEVSIHGCGFHLSQCFYTNIQE